MHILDVALEVLNTPLGDDKVALTLKASEDAANGLLDFTPLKTQGVGSGELERRAPPVGIDGSARVGERDRWRERYQDSTGARSPLCLALPRAASVAHAHAHAPCCPFPPSFVRTFLPETRT
jgi:hypothetical protein